MTGPVVVDLFAGAGGTSEGARQAGCHVAWAANHDAEAVKAAKVAATPNAYFSDPVKHATPASVLKHKAALLTRADNPAAVPPARAEPPSAAAVSTTSWAAKTDAGAASNSPPANTAAVRLRNGQTWPLARHKRTGKPEIFTDSVTYLLDGKRRTVLPAAAWDGVEWIPEDQYLTA